MSRKLPSWMIKTNLAHVQPLQKVEQNKPTVNTSSCVLTQTKVARLRSHKIFEPNNHPKRRLTDVHDEEEKREPIPYINYKGKVIYCTTYVDIACACDAVLQYTENSKDEVVPIAFDMEWPFSFTTGPGRTAVIQMCLDENECYVLHVSELNHLPAALTVLLKNPKVRLNGVNIKNDIRKLARDFPGVNGDQIIEQCVDLGVWANSVLQTSGRWSLERLVLKMCKLRIDKNKAVRMSKWHEMPLTKAQQVYAAIDVYISLVIYKDLARLEKEAQAQKEIDLMEIAQLERDVNLADMLSEDNFYDNDIFQ